MLSLEGHINAGIKSCQSSWHHLEQLETVQFGSFKLQMLQELNI